MPRRGDERCETCQYYMAYAGYAPRCQRRAPQATLAQGSPWAAVLPGDWCGEWEAVESNYTKAPAPPEEPK